MNDLGNFFDSHVSALLDSTNQLKSLLGGTPVSKGVRDATERLQTQHDQYLKLVKNGTSYQILRCVRGIAIYGALLSQRIARMTGVDDQVKQLAKSVEQDAQNLLQQSESHQSRLAPLSEWPEVQSSLEKRKLDVNIRRIEQVRLEQEKHDERIKNSLAESERRLVVMEESVKGLDQKVQEALTRMDNAYRETRDNLKTKEEEIDSILGHVSGRAIAGDFEKSAAVEMAAANWLRLASLFCMALIVFVLGYSFWETTQQDFQWQKSLFRVGIAFLLSAPAAYLARESAKHRGQQYVHLQTSLDLKAISPYLASLPQEIQHRIKGEVAAKLFGGRDFSHMGADSYPINAQELLMELVKKFELPKVASK